MISDKRSPFMLRKKENAMNTEKAYVISTNYVKRGMFALEDEDWKSARMFFDQALQYNAENPNAYLGEMLSDFQLSSLDQLTDLNFDFSANPLFRRALSLADVSLREQLVRYQTYIRQKTSYQEANQLLQQLPLNIDQRVEILQKAKELYHIAKGYKNSDELCSKCDSMIKECLYNYCVSILTDFSHSLTKKPYEESFETLKKTISILELLDDYLDSQKLLKQATYLQTHLFEMFEYEAGIKTLQRIKKEKRKEHYTIYSAAIQRFSNAGDWRDAKQRITQLADLRDKEQIFLVNHWLNIYTTSTPPPIDDYNRLISQLSNNKNQEAQKLIKHIKYLILHYEDILNHDRAVESIFTYLSERSGVMGCEYYLLQARYYLSKIADQKYRDVEMLIAVCQHRPQYLDKFKQYYEALQILHNYYANTDYTYLYPREINKLLSCLHNASGYYDADKLYEKWCVFRKYKK